MTTKLTGIQRRYIWLAGSYPDKIVAQGRGKRTKVLMYGFDGDELIIFGYGTPLYFMEGRYFRRLQAHNSYTLTEQGEEIFQSLVLSGYGMKVKDLIEEVKVKPRDDAA